MEYLRGASRAFAICLLLLLASPTNASDEKSTPQARDWDALQFERAKEVLLRGGQEPGHRAAYVPRLVAANAREAIPILVSLLDDPEKSVRTEAAQYLAMLRDRRGLDVQLKCIRDPACEHDHPIALRLLGSSDRQEFAGPIALEVQEAYRRYLEDAFLANTRHREFLRNGVVALARLGRKEDWDLILSIFAGTSRDLTLNHALLEALGYVNDPRANQALWNAYEALLRPPRSFDDAFPGSVKHSKCLDEGRGVKALLPLSRLGDRLAIEKLEKIIRGIGTPEDPWGHSEPTLCTARGVAIADLKPRDARNFAEAVFAVAAQEPEGPGTREAWDAMGIMHPAGFGDRLFKLSMRSKPHWKFVTRQALHDAIFATDPSLDEAFWREYSVALIPANTSQKALVELGLGRLMYSGAKYWMEWTGD